MKIRFAIVAAVITAAAACSNLPTAVDQRAPHPGAVVHDGDPAAPPPQDTTNRGGGGLGSGN